MRIDAHHHLWDPGRGDYGWLTPVMGGLYRTFSADDLSPLLAAAGIDGTLLVQAAPTEAETDWLLDIARATPWIAGVVGWLDLEAADITGRIAARAADPLFVGVRPMLQDLAQRDWILRAGLTPALAALAAHGLVFDALIAVDQIDVVVTLAARHPDLTIVIDHAAKPLIGDAAGWSPWADGMDRLAARPNVACKLSGLLTEAPAGADTEMLHPYAAHLLAAFGADRLVWGSDWPVLTTTASYADWWRIAAALIPAADHQAVFGGNAVRLYRLRPGG
ncbi:amidohydrolase [Sphingomonas sp. Leaf17]|uniref:amidohydrolase family protein n=1 Tax=Sphingomonas sp. Leaf17 TaxID=1735683 RepID=UPI0006FDE68F|nr:amidohydrolase family protein [Sphingomonas sp. Leaf17]KQM62740.1 amidohydrolase [Sphingomonas sp. Leaf17]